MKCIFCVVFITLALLAGVTRGYSRSNDDAGRVERYANKVKTLREKLIQLQKMLEDINGDTSNTDEEVVVKTTAATEQEKRSREPMRSSHSDEREDADSHQSRLKTLAGKLGDNERKTVKTTFHKVITKHEEEDPDRSKQRYPDDSTGESLGDFRHKSVSTSEDSDLTQELVSDTDGDNSRHRSSSVSERENSKHKSASDSERENSRHKSNADSGEDNFRHKSNSDSGDSNIRDKSTTNSKEEIVEETSTANRKDGEKEEKSTTDLKESDLEEKLVSNSKEDESDEDEDEDEDIDDLSENYESRKKTKGNEKDVLKILRNSKLSEYRSLSSDIAKPRHQQAHFEEGEFGDFREEVLHAVEDRLLKDVQLALKGGFSVDDIIEDLEDTDERRAVSKKRKIERELDALSNLRSERP